MRSVMTKYCMMMTGCNPCLVIRPMASVKDGIVEVRRERRGGKRGRGAHSAPKRYPSYQVGGPSQSLASIAFLAQMDLL